MAKGIKLYYFLKILCDRFYEILNGKQKADSGSFDWGVTTNQA
jgi:hypothetical protein